MTWLWYARCAHSLAASSQNMCSRWEVQLLAANYSLCRRLSWREFWVPTWLPQLFIQLCNMGVTLETPSPLSLRPSPSPCFSSFYLLNLSLICPFIFISSTTTTIILLLSCDYVSIQSPHSRQNNLFKTQIKWYKPLLNISAHKDLSPQHDRYSFYLPLQPPVDSFCSI